MNSILPLYLPGAMACARIGSGEINSPNNATPIKRRIVASLPLPSIRRSTGAVCGG
jgi:hypothetical protein